MNNSKKKIVITAKEIATLRKLGWEGIIRKAMAYNPTKKDLPTKRKRKE